MQSMGITGHLKLHTLRKLFHRVAKAVVWVGKYILDAVGVILKGDRTRALLVLPYSCL